MANHSKNRQKPQSSGYSRSASGTFPSAHPSRSKKKLRKKRLNSPLLWLAALMALFVFYISRQEQKSVSDSELPDQMARELTIDESVKRKNERLQLEQAIHSQEVISEKFKKPVESINPLDPNISPLDMGIRFSNDASMREVSKNLEELPFENDMYEDPEDIVRRKMVQQEWLEQQLQQKDEREREEFIRRFVEIAQEQGYKVHFTNDMKEVILEPIEENKNKEEEEEFEKVQINWQ